MSIFCFSQVYKATAGLRMQLLLCIVFFSVNVFSQEANSQHKAVQSDAVIYISGEATVYGLETIKGANIQYVQKDGHKNQPQPSPKKKYKDVAFGNRSIGSKKTRTEKRHIENSATKYCFKDLSPPDSGSFSISQALMSGAVAGNPFSYIRFLITAKQGECRAGSFPGSTAGICYCPPANWRYRFSGKFSVRPPPINRLNI